MPKYIPIIKEIPVVDYDVLTTIPQGYISNIFFGRHDKNSTKIY